MEVDAVATAFLFYLIVPLWLGAGFADWAFHRRTRIESTSGFPESALHAVMLAEVGIPMLAVIFLQINGLVMALLLASLLAHTITTYADLRWTHGRREIGPGEQMAHGLLEVLPLLTVSFAVIGSWPVTLTLFGFGDQPPDFRLRLREVPLLSPAWGMVLAVLVILTIGLYLEELVRTIKGATTRQHLGEPQRAGTTGPGRADHPLA